MASTDVRELATKGMGCECTKDYPTTYSQLSQEGKKFAVHMTTKNLKTFFSA